jgi:tRNA A37 threonylcarbamoyladenosine dehydratase
MDLDDVCVTNINRQVHATGETIGQPKTGAMAERLRVVSPGCVVEEVREFYDASTEEQLFGLNPSLVIDAVDSTADKARLIAAATRRGVPVVTVGAAGGRRDPASVRRGDLGATGGDPLLREVRRRLRAEQGWAVAERAPWGVPAVFSVERAVYPTPKGETCDTPSPGARVHLDCRSGYGTSAMVAGTFGLTAAAIAVDLLIAS